MTLDVSGRDYKRLIKYASENKLSLGQSSSKILSESLAVLVKKKVHINKYERFSKAKAVA